MVNRGVCMKIIAVAFITASILLGVSQFKVEPLKLKTLTVAVIDTGVRKDITKDLCPTGHHDFTEKGLADVQGHGTNISGLISKEAQGVEYCQVILKYSHDETSSNMANYMNSADAFKRAVRLSVDVINFSSYGRHPSPAERLWIMIALYQGIKVVTVSGNIEQDLDKDCNVYPACYDSRIIVVGRERLVKPFPPSGFGSIVDVYLNGLNQTAHGVTLSGTSQSAARYTGKLIRKLVNESKKRR
jgi:subtilisin family serine protease